MRRQGDIRSRIKRLERESGSAASDGELRHHLALRLVEFIRSPERVRRVLEDPGSRLGGVLRCMAEFSQAREAARAAGASLSEQAEAGRNAVARAGAILDKASPSVTN